VETVSFEQCPCVLCSSIFGLFSSAGEGEEVINLSYLRRKKNTSAQCKRFTGSQPSVPQRQVISKIVTHLMCHFYVRYAVSASNASRKRLETGRTAGRKAHRLNARSREWILGGEWLKQKVFQECEGRHRAPHRLTLQQPLPALGSVLTMDFFKNVVSKLFDKAEEGILNDCIAFDDAGLVFTVFVRTELPRERLKFVFQEYIRQRQWYLRHNGPASMTAYQIVPEKRTLQGMQAHDGHRYCSPP